MATNPETQKLLEIILYTKEQSTQCITLHYMLYYNTANEDCEGTKHYKKKNSKNQQQKDTNYCMLFNNNPEC